MPACPEGEIVGLICTDEGCIAVYGSVLGSERSDPPCPLTPTTPEAEPWKHTASPLLPPHALARTDLSRRRSRFESRRSCKVSANLHVLLPG
jgi:hypothetical protein